jgi:NTP pyrophosphatase (non-canonical NTP hydrolase)
MQLFTYQEWVRKRWARSPRDVDLSVMAMGLAGEGGEVAEAVVGLFKNTGKVIEPIKKLIRGSRPGLDTSKLSLELGDVLHYVTAIANHFNIDMEDVVTANVDKLEARDAKDPNWLGNNRSADTGDGKRGLDRPLKAFLKDPFEDGC